MRRLGAAWGFSQESFAQAVGLNRAYYGGIEWIQRDRLGLEPRLWRKLAANGRLSRNQEAALAALLTEPTVAGAAEKVRVGGRTLEQWLAESPEFVASYRDGRCRVVKVAISDLQKAAALAVSTLIRNCDCGSPHAEIRAADRLLDHMTRIMERTDLEERMERLERAMERPRILWICPRTRTVGESPASP